MSFYGASFSYNGKSCEDFGLMMYDFNNTNSDNTSFASVEVDEDRLNGRPRSILYGTYYKNPLEFNIVFGVCDDVAIKKRPIDRYDMQEVAEWITDQDQYHWLLIDQPDMEAIKYNCIITDLEVLEYSGDKWAYKAKVRCDSPYAYKMGKTFGPFSASASGYSFTIKSESTSNKPFYPVVTLSGLTGGTFSIINTSDSSRETKFTSMPNSITTITIDGNTGVVSTNSSGINVYPSFNFVFPRIVKGNNNFTITGSGNLSIYCEFPVNVGG